MTTTSPARRRSLNTFVALGALVLAGCGGAADATPTSPAAPDPRALAAYFPPTDGSSWETISPTRLGYDSAALASALDWAGTQRSTAVIIAWRGRIVAERYWKGWTAGKDSSIASASKSVLSAMAGDLVRTGQLSLEIGRAHV